MNSKPALRTDTQPPQRLPPSPYDLRRLIDPPLQHLPVLHHLRELARHNPEHHVLARRQVLQQREPPRARRVVLEVGRCRRRAR